MISKGPRYFLESFFEGQVVWKNFAFTKALSPTLNSGGGSGSCLPIADSVLGIFEY
jgi:hypothetical protein